MREVSDLEGGCGGGGHWGFVGEVASMVAVRKNKVAMIFGSVVEVGLQFKVC